MGPFRKIAGRIRYTGNCVVCGFKFTEKFPDDFPEEFKFCCSCLAWAKFMLEKDYGSFFWEGTVVNPIIKKIHDIITLVG